MHHWTMIILGMAGFLLCSGAVTAQETGLLNDAGQGVGICRFVDEDGDGFNDLAPDDDGDGIPNGLDPDYVRPQDGSGNQHQMKHAHSWQGTLFSRVFGLAVMSQQAGSEHQHGPGSGPGVNTGFGPGENGVQGTNGISDQGHRNERRNGRN